ncbi:MAG: DUF2339 domain-containing protein [Opitutae bacterium]|nr:DUF2339 domain-containing protein [Opitutae bacterium]
MPPDPHQPPAGSPEAVRLAHLEARLARLEAHLGVPAQSDAPEPAPVPAATADLGPPAAATGADDEFEFEVGQNWFAIAGILALALGAGFMLSLPHARLPAAVPSLAGGLVAAGLFLLAHVWRNTFELVAGYLRGAGLALLWFATLRLYFFGAQPVLSIESLAGRAPLALAAGFNLVLAWRRQSPWLTGLALLSGYATAIAVGSAGFVLGSVGLLAVLTVVVSVRAGWPRLGLVGIPLGYGTYLLWAVGNPFRGGAFHLATAPAAAPAVLLALAGIFATASLLRPDRDREDAVPCAGALLNCGLGYFLFLVHTVAASTPGLAAAHGLAFAEFLGLAVVFWLRERSRVSTFLYAMTGYAALSVAIMKASAVPEVFVWLSLQSVIVAATAVWFRSRFIVVANFLIYVAIVLAYIFVSKAETGISIGFGLVALVSARLLNWQQDRLELKTDLMRNAYLFAAFVVFPYALYHLVPVRFVGLAWVGLALFYYTLNLLVRSPKFRWMGHATLLLTAIYVTVVGTSRFGPVLRVLSFLALGTVMLVVSLIFTRLRSRPGPDKPG